MIYNSYRKIEQMFDIYGNERNDIDEYRARKTKCA